MRKEELQWEERGKKIDQTVLCTCVRTPQGIFHLCPLRSTNVNNVIKTSVGKVEAMGKEEGVREGREREMVGCCREGNHIP